MSGRAFRPTVARVQKSSKVFNSTKTNATIRDLEEEEGELEEKEGTVVSIDRDKINGTGWTVQDSEGNTYLCSCASSMYEVPETVERGGVLYPTETVTVTFTVNPVLRINTIKEITSLGEETEKVDVSQWTHGDKATTVIAKPKSAISISDGLIKMDYNNDNSVLADPDAVKIDGKETEINTDKLTINSPEVQLQGVDMKDILDGITLDDYSNYDIGESDDLNVIVDNINGLTQADISGDISSNGTNIVIGELKNQLSFPLRTQTQKLVTDGILTIDENGIISAQTQGKTILGNYSWATPQSVYRNYIKIMVKNSCDYCVEGINNITEYINYCPSCQNWNTLVDASTSIRCITCKSRYCQNCGTNLKNYSQKLKKYSENYIIGQGTTCSYCDTQLESDTTKYYVNYCPDCKKWGYLYSTETNENNKMINIFQCGVCNAQFCCSCGTSQTSHGLTLSNNPVQYSDYADALRKLRYIRDGNDG